MQVIPLFRKLADRFSLERLSKRWSDMKAAADDNSAEPSITFDKDDEDTLDFVTASANLRSIVFGIETKSRFDVKQMAGNIIPAIATTNAIVAGLCVLQAFKVLRGDFSNTKEVSNHSIKPLKTSHAHAVPTCHSDCTRYFSRRSRHNDSYLPIDFGLRTQIAQCVAWLRLKS